MHLIEHTFSPTRLLLAWQAPDSNDRSHFVVGELRERDALVSFRYLTNAEDFRKAVALGFACYPAFRKHEREYTEGVMSAFLRRLPPRSRGDFPRFLKQWCLAPDAALSDFALLAYSGAKLPYDGFSVVWPMDEVGAPGEVLLEVAGFRYQGVPTSELSPDMQVRFFPEPENEVDHKAIRIEAGGRKIGYVKRAQRDAVASWLARCDVEASIDRFNGTAERPVVYVFCRLSQPTSELVARAAAG